MDDYKPIKDRLRNIEFNLTEPEVLTELTTRAISLGDEFKTETKRNIKLGQEIIKSIKESEDSDILCLKRKSIDVSAKLDDYIEIVGLDGSVQVIGNEFSNFVFIYSAAAIIMDYKNPSVILDKPIVYANIEKEQLKPFENPNFKASLYMLGTETKLLVELKNRRKKSVILLDEPIIDPPQYTKASYLNLRTNAILNHLDENNILVGCAKRVADRYFINFIFEKLAIKAVNEYINDNYLMTNLISSLRRETKNYNNFLATNWIDISDSDKTTTKYKEKGVYIITFFCQREIRSKIIRCDIALNFNPSQDFAATEEIFEIVIESIKNNWYIGHHYPLPVYLAHQKCNIRQGAAEVLYSEILTRGSDLDPELMIIQNLMS